MKSAKGPRARLEHMMENIDGIITGTEGHDFETIMTDFVLRLAVERALQIISEAAKELPEEVRQREPDVPWRQIISLGNYLRHEYYRINQSDVRSILQTHLPALRSAVLRLLNGLDPETARPD